MEASLIPSCGKVVTPLIREIEYKKRAEELY